MHGGQITPAKLVGPGGQAQLKVNGTR